MSTKTQGANCTRKGKLDVKPKNSSHLILQDVFSLKEKYWGGCVSQDIKVSNLTATVESYFEEDKRFELDIDVNGNAFIPIDPCFPYKVHVSASVGNESHPLTEKISVTFNYNLRTGDSYPYNNELKNEVIDKICLISKDRIRIPDPPTSLKSCVFTKGDRLFFGESATNRTSGHVEFEIIDPASDFKNPKRICIRTLINQVEPCSKNTSGSQRKSTKLRFFNVDMKECKREGNMSDSGPMVTSQVPQSTRREPDKGNMTIRTDITRNSSDETIPMIVGIAVSVLVAIAAVFCIICLKKKRKRSEAQNTEKDTDGNPVYGTYSRGWNGEGYYGDGDRVYVSDTNEYYAADSEYGDRNYVTDTNIFYEA